MSPELTITLTRFEESDCLLRETLDRLAEQEGVRARVLFFDQAPSDELRRHCATLNSSKLEFEYRAVPARSLSWARNIAIQECTTDVLLFIDADALAQPDWAKRLGATLDRPNVGVAGGRILPQWESKPLLLARARIVRELYSLLDLGGGERVVPKIVGANFGIRIDRLRDQAYFDESLGRSPGSLLGGEETDICSRATRAGLEVRYNGSALVRHKIPLQRIRYRWIMRRIYYAGLCRGLRGGMPSPSHHMGLPDYLILPVILPSYLLGFYRGRRTADPPE